MNSRHQRALQFKDKAEKWARWARSTYDEFYAHSEAINMDAVDRSFTMILFQLTTVHDALKSGAEAAELTDWASELNSLRNSDELLFYIWQARNTETHDALIKWQPNANRLSVRTVDPVKLAAVAGGLVHADDPTLMNHILLFLYEARDLVELSQKMEARFRPSKERQDQAGVTLTHTESLGLAPFKTRDKRKSLDVQSPKLHMGFAIEPSAHGAINAAIGFYEAKVTQLSRLLGHPPASTQQSPLSQRQ